MSEAPPEAYVQLDFTLLPSDLEDAAIAVLEAEWEDWSPNDGDMEVVQIEALSPMAAAVARMAAEMPPAALIAFGEKLLNTPIEEGVAATGFVTVKVQDEEGYEVDAGVELDVNGVAFQTSIPLVIPPGSTTGVVEITANEIGEVGNALTSPVQAVTFPIFVTSLVLTGPTSGGKDEENQNEYLDRISTELQLRSKSIITLRDFGLVATELQGVGAALVIADEEKPRNIHVYLRNDEGQPASEATKLILKAIYEETRMVNAIVDIKDATYLEVDVDYKVRSLPGVDPVALKEAIDSRLTETLEPSHWGIERAVDQPTSEWVQTTPPLIRLTKLIYVIGTVQGVDFVETIELNGAAEDLALPEPVGLPTPGTMTGAIESP